MRPWNGRTSPAGSGARRVAYALPYPHRAVLRSVDQALHPVSWQVSSGREGGAGLAAFLSHLVWGKNAATLTWNQVFSAILFCKSRACWWEGGSETRPYGGEFTGKHSETGACLRPAPTRSPLRDPPLPPTGRGGLLGDGFGQMRHGSSLGPGETLSGLAGFSRSRRHCAGLSVMYSRIRFSDSSLRMMCS